MSCTKNAIPKDKVKRTLREAEKRYGVPVYAYDCQMCGNLHYTTEVPGSRPNKTIFKGRVK